MSLNKPGVTDRSAASSCNITKAQFKFYQIQSKVYRLLIDTKPNS